MQISDPFKIWEEALSFDLVGEFESSARQFKEAGKSFFDSGTGEKSGVGKAFFEYSWLMDAFAAVQTARSLKLQSEYDLSLQEFTKAAEIFRSTVHYGFLSAYVSGCATLETALGIEDSDEEFEALKSTIALFEQSKLALGFRDERHPLVNVIDSMIKYSISEALLAESKGLAHRGISEESQIKLKQSKSLEAEHELFAMKVGKKPRKIDYLPLEDWKRVKSTGYVISFPELNTIWFGNVGLNTVIVETFANTHIGRVIEPYQNISCALDNISKGRVRIVYVDESDQKRYDEGCLSVI